MPTKNEARTEIAIPPRKAKYGLRPPLIISAVTYCAQPVKDSEAERDLAGKAANQIPCDPGDDPDRRGKQQPDGVGTWIAQWQQEQSKKDGPWKHEAEAPNGKWCHLFMSPSVFAAAGPQYLLA